MQKEKIWSNYDFSGFRKKSTFDLILTQLSELEKKTNGRLKIDVESINNPVIKIIYVSCPHLHDYRIKLFSIFQCDDYLIFPCKIISHVNDVEYDDISEDIFPIKITELINSKSIKNIIEYAYYQSR